jgi:antitoxin PrlF
LKISKEGISMAIATLTNKGQVTIPKAVRESLGLHSGDKLEFVIVENGKACIRPVTKKVDDVFGRLYKPEKKPVSVEEMDEKIRQKMRAISQ